MRKRACAVAGCNDWESSRHRFPNPDVYAERFQKWLEACGNQKLFTVDRQIIYKNYRVCHKHFTQEDILSNTILLNTAIPNQLLPILEQAKENTDLVTLPHGNIDELPCTPSTSKEKDTSEETEVRSPLTSRKRAFATIIPSTKPKSLLQEVEVHKE